MSLSAMFLFVGERKGKWRNSSCAGERVVCVIRGRVLFRRGYRANRDEQKALELVTISGVDM